MLKKLVTFASLLFLSACSLKQRCYKEAAEMFADEDQRMQYTQSCVQSRRKKTLREECYDEAISKGFTTDEQRLQYAQLCVYERRTKKSVFFR